MVRLVYPVCVAIGPYCLSKLLWAIKVAFCQDWVSRPRGCSLNKIRGHSDDEKIRLLVQETN